MVLGGAWTSFNEQLSSNFYVNAGKSVQSNGGFRLAGPIVTNPKIILNMLQVNNINNPVDVSTGLGSVSYPYKISQLLITNGQYTQFLNSIAKIDTHKLYTDKLKDKSFA
jgi:hypothetical protein